MYVSVPLALLVVGFSITATTASAQLLEANTSIDVRGTSNDSSASGSAQVNMQTGEDEAEGTDTDMSASSDTGSATGFSLTRSQMNDDTEYTVSSASSVRSIANLESYAASTIRKDERLESVEVKDDSLLLSYRKDTRFLGFLPGSMRAHVTVDASGDVSVRYPWYAFMMSTTESSSDLEARLDSELALMSGSMASLEEDVSTSEDDAMWRWAQLFERVYTALSAEATVSA